MADDLPAPAWGYREGEAKIFEDGVLPKGWVDSPAKVKAKGKAEDAEANSSEAGE
jgi:hypothetical protein